MGQWQEFSRMTNDLTSIMFTDKFENIIWGNVYFEFAPVKFHQITKSLVDSLTCCGCHLLLLLLRQNGVVMTVANFTNGLRLETNRCQSKGKQENWSQDVLVLPRQGTTTTGTHRTVLFDDNHYYLIFVALTFCLCSWTKHFWGRLKFDTDSIAI